MSNIFPFLIQSFKWKWNLDPFPSMFLLSLDSTTFFSFCRKTNKQTKTLSFVLVPHSLPQLHLDSVHFSLFTLPSPTQLFFMETNVIAFLSNLPSFTPTLLSYCLHSQNNFLSVYQVMYLLHLKTINSFPPHLEPKPNSL